MPTYQTTGIVIGRTNFGEADRIIRLITPDRGKLSVVARGVRKIKSRQAGHLEPFGVTKLMLATGRNLDTITSAKLEWYPTKLTDDYTRAGLAYMAASMIDRLVEEHQSQPELFALLREAYEALDGGAGGRLFELWFKLRLMNELGYHPQLEGCAACGRRDASADYGFDAEAGGITCRGCGSSLARPISVEAIKLWRMLSARHYDAAGRIAGGEALASASLVSVDDFYEFHLGRRFAADAIGSS